MDEAQASVNTAKEHSNAALSNAKVGVGNEGRDGMVKKDVQNDDEEEEEGPREGFNTGRRTITIFSFCCSLV